MLTPTPACCSFIVRLLLEAFERHAGYPVDEEGDALFVAFARAEDAVAAAADGQLALAGRAGRPASRSGSGSGSTPGEPLAVPPNYVGMDVHRAARIMAAGHGGQVLVSGTTRALLDGVELVDLGPHRLKDMLEPIHLYQLGIDGLPRFRPRSRCIAAICRSPRGRCSVATGNLHRSGTW